MLSITLFTDSEITIYICYVYMKYHIGIYYRNKNKMSVIVFIQKYISHVDVLS